MDQLLDTCGFEYRDVAGDRLVVASGFTSWSSFTPAGSRSQRALTLPFDSGLVTRTWRRAPTDPRYGMLLQFHVNTGHTNANTQRLGCGRSGVEGITLSRVSTTGEMTLRVGGSVVATHTAADGIGSWIPVRIAVDHQEDGLVRVWVSGALRFTYTLTGGDITALGGLPDRWWWAAQNSAGQQMRIDECAAFDLSTGLDLADYASLSIETLLLTGAGARQEGTGAYTAADELPMSATDSVVFDAVGEGADYTVQAHPGATRQSIAVYGHAYLTRVGTTAGDEVVPYIREASTVVELDPIAAPEDGHVEWEIPTARDGTAWESTNATVFNAHTFGLETAEGA